MVSSALIFTLRFCFGWFYWGCREWTLFTQRRKSCCWSIIHSLLLEFVHVRHDFTQQEHNWFTLVFSAEKYQTSLWGFYFNTLSHSYIRIVLRIFKYFKAPYLSTRIMLYCQPHSVKNCVCTTQIMLKKQITVINMILLYGCKIQEQGSKLHVELAKTF